MKLNEYYHSVKFDIYHTYSVRENHNVNIFATYGQSAVRPALHSSLHRRTFFMSVKNYSKTTSTRSTCPLLKGMPMTPTCCFFDPAFSILLSHADVKPSTNIISVQNNRHEEKLLTIAVVSITTTKEKKKRHHQ